MKIFIALLPVWMLVFCVLCYVTYFLCDKYQTYLARKNQYVAFGNLKKGNFIWRLSGDKIKEYQVKEVVYRFDSNNKLEFIYLDLSHYNSLTIYPHEFKLFKCTTKQSECYTYYKEAETKRYLNEISRKSELDNALCMTPEELKSETERMCRELRTLGEETEKKLKLKLN